MLGKVGILMNKDNQMTFAEWMTQINGQNSDLSSIFGGFPIASYSKMKKEEFKNLCYRNIYIRLVNICLSLFKWTLPDTMDERVLEIGYLLRGSVCVCKLKEGIFGLPCTPNNMYNIYGNPTQARAMALNGMQWTVNVKYKTDIPHRDTETFFEAAEGDAVYSKDNKLAYPYINYVREYAYKISDKLVALNIAAQRLKSPFVYIIDEYELKDTVQRLVDKIESNDDIIVRLKHAGVGKELENSIQLEPNNMKPEIIQSLKDAILFDFNMFLETIGINTNPSPDKSQVVLTPELESNNGLISLEQDIRFRYREELCEDAKSILGVEMSVEKTVDEAQQMINDFRQGVQNGFDQGQSKEAGHPSSRNSD